ncbi:hypothetical protein D3C75_591780 [compost metagenome]
MTDVQRFRQSGYDKSLLPSTTESEAHYMFYKDHAVVVSLLREQLTKSDAEVLRLQRLTESLLEMIADMREGK